MDSKDEQRSVDSGYATGLDSCAAPRITSSAPDAASSKATENVVQPAPAGFGNLYGPGMFPDCLIPNPHPGVPAEGILDHPLTYDEIVTRPGFKTVTKFFNIPICIRTIPDSTQACGYRTEFPNGVANAVLSLKAEADGSFRLPEGFVMGPNFAMTYGLPHVLPSTIPFIDVRWSEQPQLELNSEARTAASEPQRVPGPGTAPRLQMAHGNSGSPSNTSSNAPTMPLGYRDAACSTFSPPALATNTRQRRRRNRHNHNKPKICKFCKSNKEPETFYRSHEMEDYNGRVTCPILRKLICPLCGGTEDEAHTRKYCPIFLERLTEMNAEERKAMMKEPQNAHTIARNSFGVKKAVIRYI